MYIWIYVYITPFGANKKHVKVCCTRGGEHFWALISSRFQQTTEENFGQGIFFFLLVVSNLVVLLARVLLRLLSTHRMGGAFCFSRFIVHMNGVSD